MREIKINCFKDSQDCQIISERKNFLVNDYQDREYLFSIQNSSDYNCQLSVSAISQDQGDLSLLIQKNQEIIFHDQLNNFFNQEIALGNINEQSTQDYTFHFDASKLIFMKQNISLGFDLKLNFSCSKPEIINFTEEPVIVETSSAVLGTKTSSQSDYRNPFLFSLICLFVFLFFVIMRFINGKKQKK